MRRARGSMSGVSREAPPGVRGLQRLAAACPGLVGNRLRWYQASVLALTYVTYMTYHLTRKPLSVVKAALLRNCSGLAPPPGTPPDDDHWCNWPPFNTTDANALLGALDSAFLFSYAAAMFVSGMIAERVDLRYFLCFGMLSSAIFCYLFGLAKTYNIHHIAYYILVQAGAGICQTSGWPGTVAVVGKWFGDQNNGLIFGLWNSHTSLGNILGTLMAAQFVESDWALSFVFPALAMGVAAALVWLLLVPEPARVGLGGGGGDAGASRSPRHSVSDAEEDDEESVVVGDQTASLRSHRHSANVQQRDIEATEQTSLLRRESPRSGGAGGAVGAAGAGGGAVSFRRALAIPGVVQFSVSLFFAKLVSYTFLYWLPLYINSSTRLSARQSGELSTVFDVGGALGAALAGLLADCSAAPALVCAAFYTLAAPTLILYQQWGASSYLVNMSMLTLAGALVNAPYALITTAVSAQLGTHSSLAGNARALATVTAVIDGTGSVGAAVGPLLAGVASGGGGDGGGWGRVFLMLVLCNVAALLALLPTAYAEARRLRRARRASPPRARLE